MKEKAPKRHCVFNSFLPSVGILLLVVLVPGFFSTRFFHPFFDAKSLVSFIILGSVLFCQAFFCFRTAVGHRQSVNTSLRSLPLFFILVATVYGSTLIIACLRAEDEARAVGIASGQLVSLICLFLFSKLPKEKYKLLWWALIVSGLPVLVAGALQLRGVHWVPRGRTVWSLPTATLGAKNMAAQFLMLYLCGGAVGLFAWHHKLHVWQKIIVAFVMGSASLQFVELRSRSAWLGLACALLVLIASIRIRSQWSLWCFLRRIRFTCSVGCAFGLGLFVWGGAAYLGVSNRGAATDATSLATGVTRLTRWTNSLVLVAEKPLLGHGLGGFRVEYPRVAQGDPEFSPRSNVQQAHNEYLQWAVELGLLGLIIFIGLIVQAGRYLIRKLPVDPQSRLPAIPLMALAMLSATAVQTFFSFAFHNPVPQVVVWAFVGAGLSETFLTKVSVGVFIKNWRADEVLKGVAILLLAGFLFFMGFQTYRTSLANALGHRQAAQEQFDKSEGNLKIAITSWDAHANRALLKLCYVQGKLSKRRQAINTCREALTRQPHNPIIHDQLARQYQANRQSNKALYHYKRAFTLLPAMQRSRHEYDKLLRHLGKKTPL